MYNTCIICFFRVIRLFPRVLLLLLAYMHINTDPGSDARRYYYYFLFTDPRVL